MDGPGGDGGGIVLSLIAAYAAAKFNNIMDMLQLVFAFVNAPLFATFMLGMFWKRTTGHGAFFGLLSGTIAAAIHHGLSLPGHAVAVGIKGGWLGGIHHYCRFGAIHYYPSEMAQGFWTAIWAFAACFVMTMLVSLLTKRKKSDEDLKGLVYSLTPRIKDHDMPWYKQPATLAVLVLLATVVLNIIFW